MEKYCGHYRGATKVWQGRSFPLDVREKAGREHHRFIKRFSPARNVPSSFPSSRHRLDATIRRNHSIVRLRRRSQHFQTDGNTGDARRRYHLSCIYIPFFGNHLVGGLPPSLPFHPYTSISRDGIIFISVPEHDALTAIRHIEIKTRVDIGDRNARTVAVAFDLCQLRLLDHAPRLRDVIRHRARTYGTISRLRSKTCAHDAW